MFVSRPIIALLLPLLLASLAAAQPNPAQPAQPKAPAAGGKPLTTIEQQASYAIGLDFARRLKSDEAPIDVEAILRGLRDGLTDAKSELTDEQIQVAMPKFISALKAKRAEPAKKEAAAFLAENKTKQGVKQTASGLQYKVIKAGTGAMPKATDAVRVHYHGTFLNGKVFDSSVVRKEPAEFGVDGVIPGWTEALQLMRVGDKWQLYIPSDLAYGDDGNQAIPPGTMLLFEVELLGIVK
jgi:FKBP-type peptidyl-prolyl cis-trans isomerase